MFSGSNVADMSVLIYVLLTVAIFALLGLVQKLVERL
ncbi:potassium-transporting ATPase [Mycolicibacterium sp. ELW1]|nr:potassium-transporting ATPase [Mycobacterium sp. ELW1]